MEVVNHLIIEIFSGTSQFPEIECESRFPTIQHRKTLYCMKTKNSSQKMLPIVSIEPLDL